jgi:hypothetical protein
MWTEFIPKSSRLSGDVKFIRSKCNGKNVISSDDVSLAK